MQCNYMMSVAFNIYSNDVGLASLPFRCLGTYIRKTGEGGTLSSLGLKTQEKTGGQTGLLLKICHLNTTVSRLKRAGPSSSHSSTHSDSEHGRRRKALPPSPKLWAFISSVIDGRLFNQKGEHQCKINFFRQYC